MKKKLFRKIAFYFYLMMFSVSGFSAIAGWDQEMADHIGIIAHHGSSTNARDPNHGFHSKKSSRDEMRRCWEAYRDKRTPAQSVRMLCDHCGSAVDVIGMKIHSMYPADKAAQDREHAQVNARLAQLLTQ